MSIHPHTYLSRDKVGLDPAVGIDGKECIFYDGYWIRYFDTFHNPGATAVDITVRFEGDLGSDGDFFVWERTLVDGPQEPHEGSKSKSLRSAPGIVAWDERLEIARGSLAEVRAVSWRRAAGSKEQEGP